MPANVCMNKSMVLMSEAVFKGCLHLAVTNKGLDKIFSLDEMTLRQFWR